MNVDSDYVINFFNMENGSIKNTTHNLLWHFIYILEMLNN